ncbi:MAG: hypothetical protein UY48_C0009G0010 [Candidatus Gottesmanbacteria bacterium GW2011_GWB1_49_7]|uniref:Uncharacterized protein n=1 Tax=Candidatus Gottesmanbacteria bacterium GW2011_GWB1_49_7 TaxID=1618448 RepID=A0A0G1YCV0_9BACT|nr:MAG: hypothetical protein UY48_C0009G0010 [Candidatus Gottesmanbacteria bacterium GW2011_GWB1_49_7]
MLLQMGYAEGCFNSTLILYHRAGFATVTEAIESIHNVFATYQLSSVLKGHSFDAPAGATYCNKCGKSRETHTNEVDPEQMEHDIREYASGIADGSYDLWQALLDAGWNTGCDEHMPFKDPEAKMAIVSSKGEECIISYMNMSEKLVATIPPNLPVK